jgi:uncharacterized protein YcnI
MLSAGSVLVFCGKALTHVSVAYVPCYLGSNACCVGTQRLQVPCTCAGAASKTIFITLEHNEDMHSVTQSPARWRLGDQSRRISKLQENLFSSKVAKRHAFGDVERKNS